MGRRVSREIVMKLLYQMEFQKQDKDKQVEYVFEENDVNESDKKYIWDMILGIEKNISYIDEIISSHAKGWALPRISKVDLSILRLGVYEIKFREDIPVSVSVNEAVELAKKFSGKEAGAFINGILGQIAK